MQLLVALESACAHSGLTYIIELSHDDFHTRSGDSVSKGIAEVKRVEVDQLIILMGPPWRPPPGHRVHCSRKNAIKCFVYDRLVIRQAGRAWGGAGSGSKQPPAHAPVDSRMYAALDGCVCVLGSNRSRFYDYLPAFCARLSTTTAEVCVARCNCCLRIWRM